MKKFLSVALAAVMMLSLAACGSSSNKAESSSEGGSASDKTYIIATDTTFAPFEFTNGNTKGGIAHQASRLPENAQTEDAQGGSFSPLLVLMPL